MKFVTRRKSRINDKDRDMTRKTKEGYRTVQLYEVEREESEVKENEWEMKNWNEKWLKKLGITDKRERRYFRPKLWRKGKETSVKAGHSYHGL